MNKPTQQEATISMYIRALTHSPQPLQGLGAKVLEAIQSGGDRVTLRYICITTKMSSVQAVFMAVKQLVDKGMVEIVYTG